MGVSRSDCAANRSLGAESRGFVVIYQLFFPGGRPVKAESDVALLVSRQYLPVGAQLSVVTC